ncbi:type IV pilus modification protein PilV [Ectopseudomonas hydrolytica]|uniref:Type IV pilus modification protein PilV n=1 Tax=Ectopseudomonas hydrolytica TaxID=2493633 RepID=A0ABY5AAC1_9GAMM|nr:MULTISPECIES: type IV pilus modification protein PilV [Pseudomonas]MDH0098362.1 type IV pilus modification protein PilV [Pseudomonas sp. GD04158]USR40808.1 type IV pilus modification protein PilV [Pseudomonas hydrolytica]
MRAINRHEGKAFTLIEVMVAVVILAIGLLGMGTLMMQSLQSSESAYSRSQATLLAYDIIDRMRANKVTSNSAYTSFTVTHASQSTDYNYSYSSANCPAGGNAAATGSPKATADLSEWCVQVRSSLPNVQTASVERQSGSVYRVTIEWQEANAENSDLIVEAEL